jgi:hypothetical protein
VPKTVIQTLEEKTNMIQFIGPFALAVALSLAGLNGCACFSSDPPSRPITLTLLHTNDTHSHLEPFPRDDELSAGNQGPQQGGIAPPQDADRHRPGQRTKRIAGRCR